MSLQYHFIVTFFSWICNACKLKSPVGCVYYEVHTPVMSFGDKEGREGGLETGLAITPPVYLFSLCRRRKKLAVASELFLTCKGFFFLRSQCDKEERKKKFLSLEKKGKQWLSLYVEITRNNHLRDFSLPPWKKKDKKTWSGSTVVQCKAPQLKSRMYGY